MINRSINASFHMLEYLCRDSPGVRVFLVCIGSLESLQPLKDFTEADPVGQGLILMDAAAFCPMLSCKGLPFAGNKQAEVEQAGLTFLQHSNVIPRTFVSPQRSLSIKQLSTRLAVPRQPRRGAVHSRQLCLPKCVPMQISHGLCLA